jgi:carbon-monoxide dehydrogenase small subunit
VKIEVEVNGDARQVEVDPWRRLLDVLRLDLGLTGTKEGCGEGECGACTVLVDGEAVNACLVPLVQAVGRRVTTVAARELAPVGDAFLAAGGAQCGICTPGMIVAAHAYLARCAAGGEPATRDGTRVALAGYLWRGTGYVKFVDSVLAAAGSPREPRSATWAAVGGEGEE